MKEVNLKVGNQTLNVFVNEQDGEQWIAIKPLCEILGLASQKQQAKIRNNPQFKGTYLMVHTLGGPQKSVCIPIRQIGMWICNINANKVKPEVKSKILDCQMHLQVAIYDYMTGKVSPELVQRLQTTIEHLQATVANMGNTIMIQQSKIDRLESVNQLEASYAGSRLAQQRHFNKFQS